MIGEFSRQALANRCLAAAGRPRDRYLKTTYPGGWNVHFSGNASPVDAAKFIKLQSITTAAADIDAHQWFRGCNFRPTGHPAKVPGSPAGGRWDDSSSSPLCDRSGRDGDRHLDLDQGRFHQTVCNYQQAWVPRDAGRRLPTPVGYDDASSEEQDPAGTTEGVLLRQAWQRGGSWLI